MVKSTTGLSLPEMTRPAWIVIIWLVLLVLMTACFEDELSIYPSDSIADEVLFGTEAGAESVLVDIYRQRPFFVFSGYTLEFYGDPEGTGCGSGPANAWANAFQAKNPTPESRLCRRMYYENFPYIAKINSFLTFVEATPFIDPGRKEVAKAEARFMRALYYFRLVQIYGAVPHVVEVPPPLYPPRAPLEQNYAQIIEDLEYAIPRLPGDNYAVLRPGAFEARARKAAAQGLLSKVLMTAPEPLKDISRAVQLCDAVINSGKYSLLDNYEDLWMVDNKENEESILLISLGNHQGAGSNAGSLSTPEQIWYRPTWEFYFSFEEGDSRREVDIQRLLIVIPPPPLPPLDTIRDDLYMYKFRYDPRALNGFGYDSFPMYILRLADIILLKAEALGVQDLEGNRTEILSLIEQVRNRAFKGQAHYVYAPSDIPDLDALMELLWWERRKELFFEIQSFFDAKRMGVAGTILGLPEHKWIFSLGSDALAENPSLAQNPGY
jgi:hypothetical protein